MPEELWLDLEQYQSSSPDLPTVLCSPRTGRCNVNNVIEAMLKEQPGEDPLALFL